VSGGSSLAEVVVSELGTPRSSTAELLGAGLLLLLMLAYLGIEYGLARALLRIARALKSKLSNKKNLRS
jgi:hypothetical protein